MSSQTRQRTTQVSTTSTVNRNNKTPNNKVIVTNGQRSELVRRNEANARRAKANKAMKPFTGTSQTLGETSLNTQNKVVNSDMLKNMSKNYLQSCYLNTYTTLAYLVGQAKISDAVIARYIISFETLLSKMNGKLTTDREKVFENMWNKTPNHENTFKFAGDADIKQYLKYYKNIMVDGFKIQGNSRLSTLAKNLN